MQMQKQRRQLIELQKEKNRIVDNLNRNEQSNDADEILREKQREMIKAQGARLKRNSLIKSQAELKEGRYFHGIMTFISKPLGKLNFYLTRKHLQNVNTSSWTQREVFCQPFSL